MPRSVTGLLNGRRIDIEEALKLREKGGRQRLDFQCVSCKEPVRAHKSGGNAGAHFEHFRRNPDCRLSDNGR